MAADNSSRPDAERLRVLMDYAMEILAAAVPKGRQGAVVLSPRAFASVWHSHAAGGNTHRQDLKAVLARERSSSYTA